MSVSPVFSRKAKISLSIAIVLWASAFVGIRLGLTGYSPGGLATLRFLVASIVMLMIRPWMKLPAVNSWRDRLYLMLIGVLGLGIYNIALNRGELAVSSGVASFIISQTPVVTVLFAVLFLGEVAGFKMLIGMSVSVFGVALIALGESHVLQLNGGIFDVLLATLVGAVYSVAQKPLLKKYHAIEATTWVMLGATVFLLAGWLPVMLHEIHQATWQATWSGIYLGIFPAALGYIAWAYGLTEVPASRAVNMMYFLPLVTTLMGWLVLREVPSALSLLGGLFALAGVWIVNHRRKQRNLASESPREAMPITDSSR